MQQVRPAPETARRRPKYFHADYVVRLGPERYRIADNSHPAKHVVVSASFVTDAGSTPAASTILFPRGPPHGLPAPSALDAFIRRLVWLIPLRVR